MSELLLPFDTDSPEFVRGIGIGRLWELLMTGEPIRMTVHASNAEMVMRAREATGRPLIAEYVDDNWMVVTDG